MTSLYATSAVKVSRFGQEALGQGVPLIFVKTASQADEPTLYLDSGIGVRGPVALQAKAGRFASLDADEGDPPVSHTQQDGRELAAAPRVVGHNVIDPCDSPGAR